MPYIIFSNSTQYASSETIADLHESGVVDRVRLDGRDWFVSAAVAMDMHNDGLIDLEDDYHYDGFVKKAGVKKGGGKCGRGWVGVKGSCKRMVKGGNREEAQRGALKDFATGQKTSRKPATGQKTSRESDHRLKAKAKLEESAKGRSGIYRKFINSPSEGTWKHLG